MTNCPLQTFTLPIAMGKNAYPTHHFVKRIQNRTCRFLQYGRQSVALCVTSMCSSLSMSELEYHSLYLHFLCCDIPVHRCCLFFCWVVDFFFFPHQLEELCILKEYSTWLIICIASSLSSLTFISNFIVVSTFFFLFFCSSHHSSPIPLQHSNTHVILYSYYWSIWHSLPTGV